MPYTLSLVQCTHMKSVCCLLTQYKSLEITLIIFLLVSSYKISTAFKALRAVYTLKKKC